ncbi:MAG: hypothetical protein MJ138_04040 [Kiritimatiellae bacterium]|nr:hypothetical protein [Kiritimatiellia bacterium]
MDRVEVRAPARIDLAGGWSDTPPICNALGGTVVAAAVKLSGRLPIRVSVARRPEPGMLVRSRDLGKCRELKSDAELRDHSDPRDWCALVKSALVVTGWRMARGGLEIELSSDLPKGSGLGTSSILGACLVSALERLAGRGHDVARVRDLVLELEQEMRTGGGWEDQMGALVPGVKILRSAAGGRQDVSWERLSAEEEARAARFLKARGLLYFTGEKRMARNVLRGVLKNFAADGDEGVARVEALKAGAGRCFRALKRGDWTHFAAAVNEYWMLKKAMDPGSTNDRVEHAIARVAPWTRAVTLAGAGGGGFMFILAKSAAAKREIVRRLTRRPACKASKFHDFEIDGGGLRFV